MRPALYASANRQRCGSLPHVVREHAAMMPQHMAAQCAPAIRPTMNAALAMYCSQPLIVHTQPEPLRLGQPIGRSGGSSGHNRLMSAALRWKKQVNALEAAATIHKRKKPSV